MIKYLFDSYIKHVILLLLLLLYIGIKNFWVSDHQAPTQLPIDVAAVLSKRSHT